MSIYKDIYFPIRNFSEEDEVDISAKRYFYKMYKWRDLLVNKFDKIMKNINMIILTGSFPYSNRNEDTFIKMKLIFLRIN